MSKTVEEQISGFIYNAKESLKAAYCKGYNNGLNDGNINDGTFATKVKESYDNGLNDAEKALKRVISEPSRGGLYANEMQEIFGTKGICAILLTYSVSEIIKKIREYDERKQQEESAKASEDEIHIGDEIIFEGKKYIVVYISKYYDRVVIVNDTDALSTRNKNVKKTGRKYHVAEMLEGLKNGGE